MTFRDNVFYLISGAALIAIACFAYFSFQVDWPPMFGEGGNGAAVAAAPPVAELTPEQKAGEKLFKTNCAACHKLDKLIVGPSLAGMGEKYAAEKDWLYSWIRDSQGLVKAGDTKAVQLFQEYNNTIMLGFPALSDAEIESIIAYTDK